MAENIHTSWNILPSVMNFQCRNRRAGSVFDNRYAILQPMTGGYSTQLPLAVTSNGSLQCRCHHLLHMLDKCCNNLGFPQFVGPVTTPVNRWWKHSSIFLKTKRTPTQTKGFIQFDFFSFHTTNPILMKVKCKNKAKKQHFFHNKLCTATEMGKCIVNFQNITGCRVLLAEQVVSKTRNVFQIARN